ncbi:MAG: hypothetical protein JWM81_117 [Candidatus Saccharibacteria bacterium]|nr:hypothetical protein [Candidatus Saccharibacteria bacterium]
MNFKRSHKGNAAEPAQLANEAGFRRVQTYARKELMASNLFDIITSHVGIEAIFSDPQDSDGPTSTATIDYRPIRMHSSLFDGMVNVSLSKTVAYDPQHDLNPSTPHKLEGDEALRFARKLNPLITARQADVYLQMGVTDDSGTVLLEFLREDVSRARSVVAHGPNTVAYEAMAATTAEDPEQIIKHQEQDLFRTWLGRAAAGLGLMPASDR